MTVKKYQMHGTIYHKPGSGRPYKLTPDMVKLIEDHLQKDELLDDKGYNVSKQTIIRARKILG